jgi:hypothetical protein
MTLKKTSPSGEQKNLKKPSDRRSNRLIHEKSPYLLQHAENPVDWYPWGEEAFARAHRDDKPIFLSIGYSTCHWCHVMAHESFEDPAVAQLLNESFVCVKVDREERPDLDHVYMRVCQMLTGSGGWPLTIFMTPDKKPFYAATYIAKESRFGRVGMLDLLPRIKEIWDRRRRDVVNSGDKIVAALQQTEHAAPGAGLDKKILQQAFEELSQRFDESRGGFSAAPKFPTPHNLTFLLRYWFRSNDKRALHMAEKTLQEMRCGGIYDHVGFGFHRYATDPEWRVPHFEKMLYDQALIAMAYSDAFQATGKRLYGQTIHEIIAYVLRALTAPEGGFYAGEDADSEGREGKFYVWTEDEIKNALRKDEAELILTMFNITRAGNFRDESTQQPTGTNIFYLNGTFCDYARAAGLSEHELQVRFETIRQKLFSLREQRIHPHRDNKILVDWNGLMIAALARAAQVFALSHYAAAAQRALSFILAHLRTPDGRLLHRYCAGEAAGSGMVDDYAFLIWGLIELYEATFEADCLQTALELQQIMIDHFWDEHAGGFYFTADDAEQLLLRHKEIYDGAVPSGNAVAMLNLLRLARIAGRPDFEHQASALAQAFSGSVQSLPSAYTQLMSAVDYAVNPSYEVVITGRRSAADTEHMLAAVWKTFRPHTVLVFRPADQQAPAITALAPYTKHFTGCDGRATAYVCRDYTCSLPTTDVNEMLELLKAAI